MNDTEAWMLIKYDIMYTVIHAHTQLLIIRTKTNLYE